MGPYHYAVLLLSYISVVFYLAQKAPHGTHHDDAHTTGAQS